MLKTIISLIIQAKQASKLFQPFSAVQPRVKPDLVLVRCPTRALAALPASAVLRAHLPARCSTPSCRWASTAQLQESRGGRRPALTLAPRGRMRKQQQPRYGPKPCSWNGRAQRLGPPLPGSPGRGSKGQCSVPIERKCLSRGAASVQCAGGWGPGWGRCACLLAWGGRSVAGCARSQGMDPNPARGRSCPETPARPRAKAARASLTSAGRTGRPKPCPLTPACRLPCACRRPFL